MCKRTPSEPVSAAAWRRFQNRRPASCFASSNSVAIGPLSEGPETAAFLHEAAAWLVRNERLFDVAGDDRIQSRGAALFDGPDRPRCMGTSSEGLATALHNSRSGRSADRDGERLLVDGEQAHGSRLLAVDETSILWLVAGRARR